jgi:hypothetical protein
MTRAEMIAKLEAMCLGNTLTVAADESVIYVNELGEESEVPLHVLGQTVDEWLAAEIEYQTVLQADSTTMARREEINLRRQTIQELRARNRRGD